MAEDRKSAKKTARRVLADSSNAKHRFGFAGAPSTPITTAPKLSDLWFIEYKSVSGEIGTTLDVSGLAKSISHISLMTSAMPIDAYGKRIFIPTRVDFPEVTISMYDTIDGKMFNMAAGIYSKFFKNNDAKFTSADAEEVLTSSHMHGRRIPDPEKHNYYHQHFEKITVYHFFGNLDAPSPHSNNLNAGAGKMQKIELINPLVTNLTFSPSDYSVTELRTVDMAVRPENIIISNSYGANFPAWMTLGMDYMMDELTSINKPIPDIYPDHFGPEGPRNEYSRFKKESQEERDMDDERRDAKQEVRKINELMKLYNITSQNPTSENIAELTKELKDNIGVIDIARKNRYMKSSPPSVDDNQRFASPYSATYDNPDVPGFGDLGDSNPAVDALPSSTQSNFGLPSYSQSDFGSSMINELVSSFFGNRSFNINNTNNSLFGGLKDAMRSVALNGLASSTSNRAIDGSKIVDSMSASRINSVTPGDSSGGLAPLPDTVENVYKRGSASELSPGVSRVIKYKDKFK